MGVDNAAAAAAAASAGDVQGGMIRLNCSP